MVELIVDENYPDCVIVPLKWYKKIHRAYKELERLEANGVDNWEGYYLNLDEDEEDFE